MTPDEQVSLETLKLLLQVAMADGVLADEEATLLLATAHRLKAPREFQLSLAACARGDGPPPAPDLSLLRQHRTKVLALAHDITYADGLVTEDEEAFLETVAALLD